MCVVGRVVGVSGVHKSSAWASLSLLRVDRGRMANEPCCVCGLPIDYELSGLDRMGATSEHLVPVAFGGKELPDIQELGVAHRSCNSRGGAYIKQELSRRGHGAVSGVRGPSASLMSSAGDDELVRALWGPSDWVDVPADANAPRLFSPPHSDAVGSHGPDAVEWIDRRRRGVGLAPLRWFQVVVLHRALEVDGDGEYCWRDVVVTMPRQCGKTTLLGELALWRAHQSERFGQEQNVIHVAKDIGLAHKTMQPFWSWAEDQGYRKHQASKGYERLYVGDREDGPQWGVYSHGSAFGSTSGLRLIDESAFMEPKTKDEVLDPTGAAAEGSQTWAFGMALAKCTSLLPTLRMESADPVNQVMLAEWSAAPDADVGVVGVFIDAVPHLDRLSRANAARQHRRQKPGFREQYLNQWPAVASQGLGFPPGWSDCGTVQGLPPVGGVAAVTGSRDRTSFVAVVAVGVGGGVGVWCWRSGSLAELGSVLDGWQPSRVLMGPGLIDEHEFPFPVDRVSASGSAASVSEFERQVRVGALSHEHVSWVDEQVDGAAVTDSERGRVLSEKLSSGSVEVVRALGWSVWGASLPAQVETAAIW